MYLYKVSINQLTLMTIAKIGIICNLSLWLPIGFVSGVLGALGVSSVRMNGRVATEPFSAFFGGMVMGVMFALIGTVALILGWLVSRLAKDFLAPHEIEFTVEQD